MMVKNVPIIGKNLGRVLQYEDPIYNGVFIRYFLCIRVMVSLDFPFKLGFWLDKTNVKRCSVRFKYEKL